MRITMGLAGLGDGMMARLGDVCEILNGYAFKSENYINEGVRIIRISNVQKGYIEDNAPAFYPSDDINVFKYKLYEGDILLSLTGNVGRVGILTEKFMPAALNQRVACIRVKNDKILQKSFLFYFLNNDFFEEKCVIASKGAAQKNMSTEWLKECEILIPPLAEQRKIASVLDKVSDLIFKRRKQIEKLDELVKARFVEMFGNVENYNAIEEVCLIITDGTHQSPKFQNQGIPFIFVSNIAGNKITYDAEKFISVETYNELIKRTPIEIGDVLLSTVGSYGHPAVVTEDRKFLFQRHIAYLKPNQKLINSFYFHSALLSSDAQKQIEERVKGIAQKTLNLSEIRKIRIPVPDMYEQNEFASFVHQTDNLKSTLKQSLSKLELLKKSLMQEYFG